MSLSSPTPPNPEQPSVTNAAQTANNLQAGITSQAGSNVNQVNPFGSLTYNQSGTGPGGVPLYTATTQLTPQVQQLLATLQGTQGVAGTQAQNLLTNANYGGQNPADVIGGMTSGTTQDLLNKETSYLQPYFSTATDQLDTKLRNQGLAPGTPAYDNAMRGLVNTQNNTVTGFLAQAEPAAYQQATQSYELPLNIAGTELGWSQPGMPQFTPQPGLSVQPANDIGAVANYNTAQQSAYQDKLQQQNAMLSGLSSIPSTILGGWARGGFSGIGGGTTGGPGGGAPAYA